MRAVSLPATTPVPFPACPPVVDPPAPVGSTGGSPARAVAGFLVRMARRLQRAMGVQGVEAGSRPAVSCLALAGWLLASGGVQAADRPWPSIDRPAATRSHAGATEAALIIGIQAYDALPHVPFADADADAFHGWVTANRGVPSVRVRRLAGKGSRIKRENITAAARALTRLTPRPSRIWVYYAGHGGTTATGERLLLGYPTEASLDSFEAQGVLVDELLQTLSGPEPGRTHGGIQVVALLDTCYTGVGRDGQPITAERPAVPVRDSTSNPVAGAQWSATGPAQAAGVFGPARHGAFSYFALGALRGWADTNGDGRVGASEADEYVRNALIAVESGGQIPEMRVTSLDGDLATEAREPGPDLGALLHPERVPEGEPGPSPAAWVKRPSPRSLTHRMDVVASGNLEFWQPGDWTTLGGVGAGLRWSAGVLAWDIHADVLDVRGDARATVLPRFGGWVGVLAGADVTGLMGGFGLRIDWLLPLPSAAGVSVGGQFLFGIRVKDVLTLLLHYTVGGASARYLVNEALDMPEEEMDSSMGIQGFGLTIGLPLSRRAR